MLFKISYNWIYFSISFFGLTCDLFKNLFTKYLGISLIISCSLFLFSFIMIWLSGKESACQYRRHRNRVWSLGWKDPLEEEMGTHSRVLAWKILWTEEPGGLQSMGMRWIGHDWACTHVMIWDMLCIILVVLHLLKLAVLSVSAATLAPVKKRMVKQEEGGERKREAGPGASSWLYPPGRRWSRGCGQSWAVSLGENQSERKAGNLGGGAVTT